MGDADPGAVAANPCNSATVDSIGGKNLTKGNSPTYSSDVWAFRRFAWMERTGLMGAVRPQTPHRSPRQAFGGNLEEAVLRTAQEVLAQLA